MGKDSPIICSNCSRRGHNKRTCPNPTTPTERLLPEEKTEKNNNNHDDEERSKEMQHENEKDEQSKEELYEL